MKSFIIFMKPINQGNKNFNNIYCITVISNSIAKFQLNIIISIKVLIPFILVCKIFYFFIPVIQKNVHDFKPNMKSHLVPIHASYGPTCMETRSTYISGIAQGYGVVILSPQKLEKICY